MLYLRSRRWVWLLLWTVLVAALPLGVTARIEVPGVIGGGVGSVLPLAALGPVLLGIVVAWALSARRNHLMAHAVRRTGQLDAVLVAAVVAAVGLLTAVQPDPDWMLPRNTALLVFGAATVAVLASPAAAAAVITLATVFVLTYGAYAPGARFVRVLQADPDATWPMAAAVVIGVVAIVVLAAASPRGRDRAPAE